MSASPSALNKKIFKIKIIIDGNEKLNEKFNVKPTTNLYDWLLKKAFGDNVPKPNEIDTKFLGGDKTNVEFQFSEIDESDGPFEFIISTSNFILNK